MEETNLRKATLFLGAPLSLLAAVACSTPALAQQDEFKDLDKTHWAYQAVIDLQQKGILIGYPGDYFKGKRTLTRYEFAIAIDRLLKSLPAAGAGPQGETGPAGQPGPPGPPGMTPEEVAEMQRLLGEFKNELAGLGVQVGAMQKRLDMLAKDVADIKERLDKMVQFGGDVFFGFRGNRSSFAFADYSGAINTRNPDLFTNVISPNDFHLEMKAKLSGGVTFEGDLVASNYPSYLGGSLSNGPAATPNVGLAETTFLDKAELNIPLSFGSNTVLTIGRYKNAMSPLTYSRPNYDAYFDVPWYDDGQYVSDGFRIKGQYGSVNTTLWASSYTSVVQNGPGSYFDAPLIGTNLGAGAGLKIPLGVFGPAGLATPNQEVASEGAGLHIGVPIGRIGEVGATIEDFSATDASVIGNFGSLGAAPYRNLVVYAGNFKLNPIGRFKIDGEVAKSVTQEGVVQSSPLPNDDNNAYRLNVAYSSHGIDAVGGWLYIDPRFSAPGFWYKLGDWYNPTNVEGPFARVGYNVTPKLHVEAGGSYLEGARNRSGADLVMGDKAYQGKLGVSYKINKTFSLTGDYEGLFWSLPLGGSVFGEPIDQYFTIGAGINLAGNTVLKLAYQIITASDPGGRGFGTGPGGGTTGNANVFTTQVAVHF
jgi:hypothetical protein